MNDITIHGITIPDSPRRKPRARVSVGLGDLLLTCTVTRRVSGRPMVRWPVDEDGGAAVVLPRLLHEAADAAIIEAVEARPDVMKALCD